MTDKPANAGVIEKETEGMEEERELTIEEALTELEAIIEKMEDRDSSLEETFALYERGMRMVKDCNSRIDQVEKKIQVLAEEGQEDERE